MHNNAKYYSLKYSMRYKWQTNMKASSITGFEHYKKGVRTSCNLWMNGHQSMKTITCTGLDIPSYSNTLDYLITVQHLSNVLNGKLNFIWLAKKDNLMSLNWFKTFSINLNVQHVNGMTPFDLALRTVMRYSRVHKGRVIVFVSLKNSPIAFWLFGCSI